MTSPAAPLPDFPSAGTEVVRVTAITPLTTRNPRVTEYIITAETLAAPSRLRIYATINAPLAALCDWCLQSEWPAQVGWRRTRWGLALISVERAPARRSVPIAAEDLDAGAAFGAPGGAVPGPSRFSRLADAREASERAEVCEACGRLWRHTLSTGHGWRTARQADGRWWHPGCYARRAR